MSERLYRLCVVLLLAVLVVGVLVIGSVVARHYAVASAKAAENGRYVQYDINRDTIVYSQWGSRGEGTKVIDTRTGVLRDAAVENP